MGWWKPLLLPLELLAWVGVAVCSLIHLVTMVSGAVPPRPFIMVFLAVFFITMTCTIFVARRLAPNAGMFTVYKLAYRGSPTWLRRLAMAGVLYSILVFVLFAYLTRNDDPRMVSMSPKFVAFVSGVWAAFFLSAAATFRSARWVVVHESDMKCPSGHRLPPAANYCPVCGEKTGTLHGNGHEQRV